jgi:hypothetical protein
MQSESVPPEPVWISRIENELDELGIKLYRICCLVDWLAITVEYPVGELRPTLLTINGIVNQLKTVNSVPISKGIVNNWDFFITNTCLIICTLGR